MGSPIIYWRDDRLNWEPSLWRNVDRLIAPAKVFWKPDLRFTNNADTSSMQLTDNNLTIFSGAQKTFYYNVKWEPVDVYTFSHKFNEKF
mmetsp:Transcript_33340/g.72798  ORF Transcript_33340/g.72798 Transcript_33340/m.72798 type:complete len:89 (+) Transcript_33340:1617-1883(+)|eukprot:CAMPEP_0116896416 /NCGR_PEP_ID=MMETSP0467-20121206/5667_1 /TAXON_ID=283647 /ORGANISM="Mesodinium pulex, Strain SPMC105" /LENGTH=88 /DNA_ID=CAMNT_0004567579 /DNA_START=1542 /DNA_END=1808 /DNA_ORIENTATION=+